MVQGRGFAPRAVFSPKRRDIVMIDCSPSAGVEPANPHPALVLSPHRYNVGGLALMCHITSTSRNTHFEYFLRPEQKAKHGADGYLQCDQVRSLDWKNRRAHRLGEVSEEVFREVTSRLLVLINPELGNAGER